MAAKTGANVEAEFLRQFIRRVLSPVEHNEGFDDVPPLCIRLTDNTGFQHSFMF